MTNRIPTREVPGTRVLTQLHRELDGMALDGMTLDGMTLDGMATRGVTVPQTQPTLVVSVAGRNGSNVRMYGEVQKKVREATVSKVDFFEACCGIDPTAPIRLQLSNPLPRAEGPLWVGSE
jgi:hypothetical protein